MEMYSIYPKQIRQILMSMKQPEKVQEIRMRIGQPLCVRVGEKMYYVTPKGNLIQRKDMSYFVNRQEIEITFEKLSQYSLYACQEQLKSGYITLEGGHRVGICGSVIYDARGGVKLTKITSINMRIARRLPLPIASFLPFLLEEGALANMMIISPPGCGKTTLLREMITYLSDNHKDWEGINVGIVDERSEIANRTATGTGFYLGTGTDVLDHCKKSEGMLLLLRSMSPDLIAADEIGGEEDLKAVEYIRYCGCKLLLTVHGASYEHVMRRALIGEYLTKHPFERYLFLEGRQAEGRRLEILDSEGKVLWNGMLKGEIDHR